MQFPNMRCQLIHVYFSTITYLRILVVAPKREQTPISFAIPTSLHSSIHILVLFFYFPVIALYRQKGGGYTVTKMGKINHIENFNEANLRGKPIYHSNIKHYVERDTTSTTWVEHIKSPWSRGTGLLIIHWKANKALFLKIQQSGAK